MSSDEMRKLMVLVESAIIGWDNKVRAETDHWVEILNHGIGITKESFLRQLQWHLTGGSSAFGKMPYHSKDPKETREYKEAFADVKKSVEAAVAAGRAKFQRASSEREPKEKPTVSRDLGYQTKPTIQEYTALASFLESVYGEVFPDGDPMDNVIYYYEHHGWSEGKGVAVLTKALKLINKKYESAYDLWADQWDMFMADIDPEFNPDIAQYKEHGNPWRS
jgi:hypothetical protein